ncbi:unnamed protein product [Natator depressus]
MGDLPAPTLYLSQTSAWPGDSVRLQCSMISQLLATRIVFCQDLEEVSSQRGLLGKFTYNSDHAVSGGSSGNYSCGYEIKDSDNQVIRSQLSLPQRLIITGTLPAPTLYLNHTSARPGDSVRLQCSVFSWALATRIIFFKDGEEVSSQSSLRGKLTYDYDHVVSGGSSGNYSCGYEIKDSKNQVTRSQLSPAEHLNVTGNPPPPHFSPISAEMTQPRQLGDRDIIERSHWKGAEEVIKSNQCNQGGPFPTVDKKVGPDLTLLLGITIPAVLVLAVVLYLLGKKEIVSTFLITLPHCFQLHLCQGIKGEVSGLVGHKATLTEPSSSLEPGNESNVTSAMLPKIILNEVIHHGNPWLQCIMGDEAQPGSPACRGQYEHDATELQVPCSRLRCLGELAGKLQTRQRSMGVCYSGLTAGATDLHPSPRSSIHGPREKKHRHTRPSVCSGTDVISAPLAEMQDSSVCSRITEPPKIRGNHKGRAARKLWTVSKAKAVQCTVHKVVQEKIKLGKILKLGIPTLLTLCIESSTPESTQCCSEIPFQIKVYKNHKEGPPKSQK